MQHFISSYGYLAILILMTAEAACIPVPSELTMPLGGAIAAGAVAGAHLSLPLVIVTGVVGNVIGSYLAWGAGWYGGRAVLVGRLLPVVRTFISLPAGYARMRPVRFGIYTAVGCVPWIGGLAWAGYAAGGNWQRVQHLVNTPAYIIAGLVALLVTAGIVTVIVRRRRLRPGKPGPRPGKPGPASGLGPAGGQFPEAGERSERSVGAGGQRRRG